MSLWRGALGRICWVPSSAEFSRAGGRPPGQRRQLPIGITRSDRTGFSPSPAWRTARAEDGDLGAPADDGDPPGIPAPRGARPLVLNAPSTEPTQLSVVAASSRSVGSARRPNSPRSPWQLSSTRRIRVATRGSLLSRGRPPPCRREHFPVPDPLQRRTARGDLGHRASVLPILGAGEPVIDCRPAPLGCTASPQLGSRRREQVGVGHRTYRAARGDQGCASRCRAGRVLTPVGAARRRAGAAVSVRRRSSLPFAAGSRREVRPASATRAPRRPRTTSGAAAFSPRRSSRSPSRGWTNFRAWWIRSFTVPNGTWVTAAISS